MELFQNRKYRIIPEEILEKESKIQVIKDMFHSRLLSS